MISIETCREIAARIWCDPACSNQVMNVELAEQIALMLFAEFSKDVTRI